MTDKKFLPGQMIKLLNEMLEKNANADLAKYGVTNSQMRLLVTLLKEFGGEATLKELERSFGAAQATIAGLAVRLEAKNLIESFQDPRDKRIKHIRITDKGQELHKTARASMEKCEGKLVECLEDEEKAEFGRLLCKVLAGAKKNLQTIR